MATSPTKCPACDGSLVIREVSCTTCGTRITGELNFPSAAPESRNPLDGLSHDQLDLLTTWISCDGKIQRMEEIYHSSYPTLRRRVNELIAAVNQTASQESNDVT